MAGAVYLVLFWSYTFNKKELINCKTATGYYGNSIYFISNCISSKKMNTFKYILENLDVSTFIEVMNQLKETIPFEYEKIISEYITKNKQSFQIYNKTHVR